VPAALIGVKSGRGKLAAIGPFLDPGQRSRVGTDDADRVGSQMRKMKIDDFMTRNGWIREDGRIMRDMVLQQVKSPAESRYPFDYFKTLARIPAEAAFRPLEEGGCPHAKKS